MRLSPVQKLIRRATPVISSIGLALCASSVSAQQPVDPSLDYVPGELLIKFLPQAPPAAILEAARGLDAAEKERFANIGVRHWRLGQGISTAQALKILAAPGLQKWIDYAEPNYLVYAIHSSDDPDLGQLWGLYNSGQTGGTPGADIHAVEAWAAGFTGSPSVVVGVIDTGIDYTHPDLAANSWINPGETAGNGIDDDGNGYIDDVRGWDFVNNDNNPIDDNGHGSHVAGTIGGVGNNGIGVAGVTWQVRLMPLKFLSAGGSGTTANAIKAVNYAAKKQVRITSNSWGGGASSKSLQDAIQNSGSLFIAAAGNNGLSSLHYPAGYSLANIISVAATDHNDLLAYFSNFGDWVDLAAPGVKVFSTYSNGRYKTLSGTSMATPYVSGAAALVMANNANLSNLDVKNKILQNVDVLPSLSGKVVTGGRLNIQKALGAATPTGPFVYLAKSQVTKDNNHNGTLDRGETVQMSVTLGNRRFAPATNVSATLSIDDGSGYSELQNFGDLGMDASAQAVFSFAVDPLAALGPVTFTLAINVNGIAHHLDELNLTVGEEPIPPGGNYVPVAVPGPNQTVFADAPAVTAMVTLDGSASYDVDGNGSIATYEWFEGATPLGVGVQITVPLGAGNHELTLRVTDPQGATGSATLQVTVAQRLFADDMETTDTSPWSTQGNDHDSTNKIKPPTLGATNLWHKTTRRGTDPGHSPVRSWYYGIEAQGNYDTGIRNWGRLISPAMILPATGRPELRVSQLVNVEGGNYDNADMQISTDNGVSWTNLLRRGNQMTSFVTDVVNLTSYRGQSVRIGFFIDTRDRTRNTFEGWFVDDVTVTVWP